ncbi:MAG: 4-(cytidine 5'-diphospho)-2-C-methyl-D-erythritol kinase [bacterium]
MKSELKCPAKINLMLRISGFDSGKSLHTIESVMLPVSLYDTLVVSPSSEFNINMSNYEETLPVKDNILYKIWSLFRGKKGMDIPLFSIEVEKNIPSGAGLGGGSSNGAAFLLYLKEKYCPHMDKRELVSLAHAVGSDIPFFIEGTPCRVSGTGEILTPVSISLDNCFFLLVKPDISVSTREAYTLYRKNYLTNISGVGINVGRKIAQRSLKSIEDLIHNDLEGPLFSEYPVLADIREDIVAAGARKAFMTGSGSTMVGFFRDKRSVFEAEKKLSRKYRFCRTVEMTNINTGV